VEHIFMFIAGVILLAIEIFVPSFGILGIFGISSLAAGVILAAYDTGQASLSLGIAFLAAIIVIVIVTKYFKHRGVWNRFILEDSLKTESGYISSIDKAYLVGKTGKAITSLRPAGTAELEDQRVDVVSRGEFIEAGKEIKVINVEGTRVVVSEI
jgi:membrane-bound serine protease (ClpP class)